MLRKITTTAVLARALCLLFLWLIMSQAQEKGSRKPASDTAIVVAVEGTAELNGKETSVWKALKEADKIEPGDQVRTARKSRVTIRLSDASILRVGESTFFRMIPVADPTEKRVVDIKQGSTYFFSREKPAEIRFTTPTVSGAIRGTEFVVVADAGQSTVALLDGEISLKNDSGELTLNKNEVATIDQGHAPTKKPLLNATAVIQWVLYYPAVIDPIELSLAESELGTLAGSITNYMAGSLGQARDLFPEQNGLSEAAEIYKAALDLTLGQVELVQKQLSSIPSTNEASRALHVLISAVTGGSEEISPSPTTASLALANSYYLQSKGEVAKALESAVTATRIAPLFGHAWIRRAELDLQLGHIREAGKDIEKGLGLAPRHPQGYAIRGYILAAQFKSKPALESFQKALDLDPELSSAFAGRGLEKMRRGEIESGLQDLQTAATIEPQRAVFHAYLTKAYAAKNSFKLAAKEAARAKALDSADPTVWLYSGLGNYLDNKMNTAVRELEKSLDLNQNHLLFKSPFQLEEDRAAKSANLAAVFRDVHMGEAGLHEASKAVGLDYASYSSHLFLSQSYDALSEPNKVNLRYETPRISELLLASLLAPPSGHNLSVNQSQNDVPELFEKNTFGIASETTYSSNGDWLQSASQYGTIKNFGYSFDALYHTSNGQRPNEDFNQLTLSVSAKEQITFEDSIFVEALYSKLKGGDLAQHYSAAEVNPSLRVKDEVEPLMYIGYHHEWQPGVHSLLLAGYFDSELTTSTADASPPFIRPLPNGEIRNVEPLGGVDSAYARRFEGFSLEAQQIWQRENFGFIAGTRYQRADMSVQAELDRVSNALSIDNLDSTFNLVSPYLYAQWNLFERLHLTAGGSFEHLEYPENFDLPPLSGAEKQRDVLLPKAGVIFDTWKGGTFRGMYAHSLSGASYDTSLRIEPTQLGGFTQSYRSLAPESVIGIQPGALMKTAGIGFDQKFKTDTYLTLELQNLQSDDARTIGAFRTANPPPGVPDLPSVTDQRIRYHENDLRVQLNQLLGKYWNLGGSYQLSSSDMLSVFTEVPQVPGGTRDETSTLHQLDLFAGFNHDSGFFAQYDALWYSQSNSSNLSLRPGDDFWQHNVTVGYRFSGRRAEVRMSLLNLFDRDYQLYPLNLYTDPPRDRLLTLSFKWRY